MARTKKNLGDWGEKVCAHEIEKMGFVILEKNYRTSFGEIDIIAKDKDEIVFIEVKTRSSDAFGFAIESVSQNKMNHIFATANIWLEEHNCENAKMRVDIATLDKLPNGNWKFELIKNASS